MTAYLNSSLDADQINRVIHGVHKDVFSVLGLHKHPSGKGLVVRAFLPGAQQVEVIEGKRNTAVAKLDQIHDAGLFEGKPGRRTVPFRYRLRVQYPDSTLVINDPYRFPSLISENDLYLFSEGTAERLYHWMGAHQRQFEDVSGISFVVWAPNASRVSVVGDFNLWDGRRHVMRKHPAAGIWEIFIPDLGGGVSYKYEIHGSDGKSLPLKADPFAFCMQHPPENASRTLAATDYQWADTKWISERDSSPEQYRKPVSIYEVHAGSWRRNPDQGNTYLSYRELAEQLIPYVLDLGFTHVQFMPISEYPFDGSWGYQPIGLFAPTSRFGSPDDFRYFVDCCHQQGLGVLLDWVPGHFPTDKHGIGQFDGTCLYEHEDVRKGYHPDWNTLIYNYGRSEVKSYLISNAMYWLDEFHLDGLRVDAVASMLYLDYSRKQGQWIPNQYGGRENLEAIELLRQVNSRVYFNYPGVMMVAEESTAWPGVSRSTADGGLGFGFKWNMGWMNDTLQYMSRDPIHRKHHHNEMTFALVYSFSENFVLPISHDEVVHGKGSLVDRMPGDDWQRFANLRAYLGFMWTHPGKKLLFMGCEFAQSREWNHDQGLDWHLLAQGQNSGIQNLVRDLNQVYANLPALHQRDCEPNGFAWIDSESRDNSILVYVRLGDANVSPVLIVVNLTPTPHQQYLVGVPQTGYYSERLNTDSSHYGGSNMGNAGGINSQPRPSHGQPHSISIAVPPLATVLFELASSE
ncbi:MAG: 1,4-alpha-glucan branching protein GlgB [Gammaproteobacteria bacterium]|nr:1,4-alpha-glucan branching protein GlgB [Gammaproteobacteria bacterium]